MSCKIKNTPTINTDGNNFLKSKKYFDFGLKENKSGNRLEKKFKDR